MRRKFMHPSSYTTGVRCRNWTSQSNLGISTRRRQLMSVSNLSEGKIPMCVSRISGVLAECRARCNLVSDPGKFRCPRLSETPPQTLEGATPRMGPSDCTTAFVPITHAGNGNDTRDSVSVWMWLSPRGEDLAKVGDTSDLFKGSSPCLLPWPATARPLQGLFLQFWVMYLCAYGIESKPLLGAMRMETRPFIP